MITVSSLLQMKGIFVILPVYFAPCYHVCRSLLSHCAQENSVFEALLYLRYAFCFCFEDAYCVARLRTSQMEQYTSLQKVGLGSCQLKPKLLERNKHLLREAMLKLSRVVWILNHMNYWQRFLAQA